MATLQGGSYAATYTGAAALQPGQAALTATAPDGTTSRPAVSLAGATATATVPAEQLGTYLLVWQITGDAPDAVVDQFECIAPRAELISLSELRAELNLASTDQRLDAKLRRWIQSATYVVENVTGPLRPAARTDVYDGETSQVILPYRWVQAITEVVEFRGITPYVLTEQPLGASVDSFGYTWDPTTNHITRRSYGGAVALFPPGREVVRISYVLGMRSIPADIQLATAELIRHWYSASQIGYHSPFAPSGPDEAGMQAAGNYMLPNRVMELLTPWRRRPGIY